MRIEGDVGVADKKTSDETQAEESQTSVSKPDVDDTTAGDAVSDGLIVEDDDTSDTAAVADLNDPDNTDPLPAEEDAVSNVSDDDGAQGDADLDPIETAEAKSAENASGDQTVDSPPAAAASVHEVERVVEKRGGFGAALLGGVVAAGLGFVAGQSNVLNDFMPPSWRSAAPVDAAALEQLKESLSAQIADLEGRVAADIARDIAPLTQQIDTLTREVASLRSSEAATGSDELAGAIETLAARVDALESRPITDAASPAAVAAFEAELSKLQDSLAAQRAEVEKMVEEARAMDAASAEAARIASAQTIVARLRSSIDAGTSFGGMIEELQAVGVTAPEALTGSAEAGVSTRASLRDGFAPAARDALASARQATKGTGGIAAYVQRQLGARSVAPRDGDDPDAVLSRAEAAVQSGDLQGALTELQALPETARAPLADWEAAARARLAAVAAVNELAQSLNAK
ncbi:hypothetical protein K4L05_17105 [Phaeobacter inhibens]|nr:hypothetical protein K4L05_17105 [Phaeobacter inhibens]